MSTLKKIRSFLDQKPLLVLTFLIIGYIIGFTAIGLWKYSAHLYNGLDLAIFNQVFYNTLHGQWFYSSIQNGSYLGDHFSPIIILLLPFYFFHQQPTTLLCLYPITLALGAVPLFYLARKVLKNNLLGLFVALIYLLSFSLHGLNVFEFEILPLAIPLIFAAYYFYHEKKFGWFLFFILAALLCREDVALLVFMFGTLAWLDRKALGERKLRWILTPMIVSAAYFLISFFIIKHFGADYKFFIYYAWLFTAPGKIIPQLFSLGNLEMLLGFCLPFLFLIWLAPKNLILALPIFIQTALNAGGSGNVVLQTHYVSLFLPALFIALIFALKRVRISPKLSLFENNFGLLIVLLVVANIYLMLATGPLGYFLGRNTLVDKNRIALENHFAEQIPSDASVVTTDRFIPLLSSRPEIYSLDYVFLGQKQFSRERYILPDDLKYLLIDFDALADYQLQYQHHSFYGKYYSDGFDNLRGVIKNFDLKEIQDNIALFERKKTPDETPGVIDKKIETILTTASRQNLRGGLELTNIGSLKRVID